MLARRFKVGDKVTYDPAFTEAISPNPPDSMPQLRGTVVSVDPLLGREQTVTVAWNDGLTRGARSNNLIPVE